MWMTHQEVGLLERWMCLLDTALSYSRRYKVGISKPFKNTLERDVCVIVWAINLFFLFFSTQTLFSPGSGQHCGWKWASPPQCDGRCWLWARIGFTSLCIVSFHSSSWSLLQKQITGRICARCRRSTQPCKIMHRILYIIAKSDVFLLNFRYIPAIPTHFILPENLSRLP